MLLFLHFWKQYLQSFKVRIVIILPIFSYLKLEKIWHPSKTFSPVLLPISLQFNTLSIIHLTLQLKYIKFSKQVATLLKNLSNIRFRKFLYFNIQYILSIILNKYFKLVATLFKNYFLLSLSYMSLVCYPNCGI